MMCITADVAVGTNRIKRDIDWTRFVSNLACAVRFVPKRIRAMFAELSKVRGLGLGIVK